LKRCVKRPAQGNIKRSDPLGSPAYFGLAGKVKSAAGSLEASAKALPPYLTSTGNMLMSAFPDGVPEKHLEAVAAILGEQLSLRNTAEVLEACGCVSDGDGYYLAMAALADAHQEQNRQRQTATVKLLREHGFDDWLKENEISGDEEA